MKRQYNLLVKYTKGNQDDDMILLSLLALTRRTGAEWVEVLIQELVGVGLVVRFRKTEVLRNKFFNLNDWLGK